MSLGKLSTSPVCRPEPASTASRVEGSARSDSEEFTVQSFSRRPPSFGSRYA